MSQALESLLTAAQRAECQLNDKNMNAHRINHTRPILAKCEHLTAANERQVRDANKVGLLDPDFVYVPAANTNIRATFARVREQMARAA